MDQIMSDDIQIEAQWVRDALANENPDLPDPPEKQFEDSISNEQAQEILPIANSPEKRPEVANMINSMSLRKNKPLDKRSAPRKTEPSKKRKVARLGNQDAQLAGPGKTQKANKLQQETMLAHSEVIPQAQRGQLKRPKSPAFRGPTHRKPGAGPFELEDEEDHREHDQDDHLGDEHQARPQQFESVAIHDTPSKSPAGSDAAFKNNPELVLSSKGKADTQADKLSSAAAPPSPLPAASRRNTRPAQKPINHSIPEGNQQSDGAKVSKLQPSAESGDHVRGRMQRKRGRPSRASAGPPVPQSEAINDKHRHNLRNRDVNMSASGQPKQPQVDAVTAASTKRDVPASRSSKRTKGQPPTPAPSEGHEPPDHEVADSDESDSREADGEGAERNEAENEEEESSSEATDSHQSDNGVSEEVPDIQEEPSPELLGMDRAWREIKLAIRTIGTSARKGKKETRENPPPKTTQIEKLVGVMKKAIKAYASPVLESSPEPTVLDEPAERQQKIVKGIAKSINKLSEIDSKGNKSDLIHDIYVHAIPQLVELLDKALEARSVQLSRKRNISALEEIIRIQDTLASLCEKALQWRAKLSTIGPLMQPVRTMGPLLQSLQGRFKATLRERKRPLELKARRLEEENDKRAWEQVQRDKQARNQEIWEAISQKSVGPRPGMVLQLSQARSQNPERRTGQAQWTDEQDLQLFMEFFAEGLQDLSGKDVYWPAAAFSR
ncbi:MAG: hypothetical protein LQ345_001127 [Seirophora villosa]|nr:MAG: hypothetical protein LQ345_001127 [Seirophora villosa]